LTVNDKSQLKQNQVKNYDDILLQKADSITRLQTPYIKKILRDLAISNPSNANLICDYIINEETQFNIKESTKDRKITPTEEDFTETVIAKTKGLLASLQNPDKEQEQEDDEE
jgi:hypothetical protein